MKVFLGAVLVLLAAAVQSRAASVSIQTTDGTGGKRGFIRGNDSSVFGGGAIGIKNVGAGHELTRKAYLRYDTSQITLTPSYVGIDFTVDLIDTAIADDDQIFHVYGITEQALDNVALTNNLPWASAPANDVASAYAADLTKALCLGTFELDATGDKAAPVGTVRRFFSQKLVDFVNADTNGIITLIIGRTGNSDNLNFAFRGTPSPTLIADNHRAVIPESRHGGQLTRTSMFAYYTNRTISNIGRSGSHPNYHNQILVFQLPYRPAGGFKVEDTALSVTTTGNDVDNDSKVDLWAIGYLPAEDIGDLNANLNSGTKDIDDYYTEGADTESKDGWNMGTDKTVKIWDNLASRHSIDTRNAPATARTSLTAFINDLFINHGASAGDYLILRNNYDAFVPSARNWTFCSSAAAMNVRPVLALSARPPKGTIILIR